MSQNTPQFFIFKQSQRELRNETYNSLFTLEAKTHKFHQCLAAVNEVRLHLLKIREWSGNCVHKLWKPIPKETNTHEPNSCVLSYHTLKLFLLPAQTHWFSFPKDYIALVSYAAWHYPRVCTTYCFIFPQLWITVSWTRLQLGRGEMYWIAYFLFLLHPQSVCACLIYNLLNNWFFSFLAKRRKSKPFFFFFSCFSGKKNRKKCFVLSKILCFGAFSLVFAKFFNLNFVNKKLGSNGNNQDTIL